MGSLGGTDTMFKLNTFFLIFSLLLSNVANALNLSVSPLLIEMNVKPKFKYKINFNVTSNADGKFKLSIYNMSQKKTGQMLFMENEESKAKGKAKGKSKGSSIYSWIKLEKLSYNVKKGETINVKGTLQVPKSAKGTFLAAIMVEEDKNTNKATGIGFSVRYAVIIAINVETRKKIKFQANMGELEVANEDGKLTLKSTIENLSKHEFRINSLAQIRDSDGKLVEKVSLKSKSAWQRKDDTSRIFPRGNVELFGVVKSIRKPGKYKILFRNKVGHQRLPAKRKTINITQDQLPSVTRVDLNKALKQYPYPLVISPRKDGKSFSSLKFKNNSDVTIRVDLQNKHTSTDKPGAYYFLPDKFSIKPHFSKKTILQKRHLSPVKKQVEYPFTYWDLDEPKVKLKGKILTSIGEKK